MIIPKRTIRKKNIELEQRIEKKLHDVNSFIKKPTALKN